MKYYLSSYKIGGKTEVEKLKKLIPTNKKTAYISNALDYSDDIERRKRSEQADIEELTLVGMKVENFDLRDYFNQPEKLKQDIAKYGVIWVRGGNAFVLRQAMKLSGLDSALEVLAKSKADILYGGYSAGVCILGPSLRGLELVDDVNQRPYKENPDLIWEGLNFFDYIIIPHYKSDHPESEAVDKVVEYFEKHNIKFKTLSDGDVLVIE